MKHTIVITQQAMLTLTGHALIEAETYDEALKIARDMSEEELSKAVGDQWEHGYADGIGPYVFEEDEECSEPSVPVKRKITIWVEGFAATGQKGSASRIGTYDAVDLKDAIHQHKAKNPGHGIDTRIGSDGTLYYSIWACQLYDNEADARKSYG